MAEPARTLHTPDHCPLPSEPTTGETPISGFRGLQLGDPPEAVSEPDIAREAYSQAVALRDACVRYAPGSRATQPQCYAPSARAKALTQRFDSDPPCDFLAYLEWRLGQNADATAKLLGEWLATYEPIERPRHPRSSGRRESSIPEME